MASGRLRIGFALAGGPYSLSAAQGSHALTGRAATLSYAGGGTLVTWTVPTQNADGTTLSDLAGFHIYYGTNSDNLTAMQDVTNPAATSASVPGLASGTWYFSVVAYDSDGFESIFSSVVSKVVT